MIWITDSGSAGTWAVVCVCLGMAVSSFLIYALHDWAENLAARAMGNRNAKLSFSYIGQMRSGINLVSTAMLILFGIGWKPRAELSERSRLKNLVISLCGPAVCFAAGIGVFFLLRALTGLYYEYGSWLTETLVYVFKGVFRACTMTAVFSLFPMLPFDGGCILRAILPERLQPIMDRSEKISLTAILTLTALASVYGLSGGINLSI